MREDLLRLMAEVVNVVADRFAHKVDREQIQERLELAVKAFLEKHDPQADRTEVLH